MIAESAVTQSALKRRHTDHLHRKLLVTTPVSLHEQSDQHHRRSQKTCRSTMTCVCTYTQTHVRILAIKPQLQKQMRPKPIIRTPP